MKTMVCAWRPRQSTARARCLLFTEFRRLPSCAVTVRSFLPESRTKLHYHHLRCDDRCERAMTSHPIWRLVLTTQCRNLAPISSLSVNRDAVGRQDIACQCLHDGLRFMPIDHRLRAT